MPHDKHCLGVGGAFSEAPQHFSIVWVLQLLHRLGDGQPLELVDFGVRSEGSSVDTARRPVSNFLGAWFDRVADGAQPPAEGRRVAGFLAYLTPGGYGLGLSGVHL